MTQPANDLPLTADETSHLESLAADEAYWDYLDEMEHHAAGAREWDNAVVGGAR